MKGAKGIGPYFRPYKKNNMKKNILIYGLIMGSIISINMVYTVNLCYTRGDFTGNDVVGYAAMIVIFSFIFIAIRNYRNKYNDGVISFGSAFKMGAFIALIAATLYVVTWLFYYYLFVPDFLDKYIPHVINEATAQCAAISAMRAPILKADPKLITPSLYLLR